MQSIDESICIAFQVFDSLVLSAPSKCAGQVLMTPNTEAKLKTNRDGAARMTYSVQNNNELLTVKENGKLMS